MNKEQIRFELDSTKKINGARIISPGQLSPQDTATNLVALLQTMYVEHGVTKNIPQLVEDISAGKVKTWFTQKDGKLVATSSLVKQENGAWELGRAVSTLPGTGKQLMLISALDHLSNNPGDQLIAEVRAAKDFMGIPGSEATQHICLDLLELVPHALIPLFHHGKPTRHEPFILASSNLTADNTISNQIRGAMAGRDHVGTIVRTKVVMEAPFKLIVPDDNGVRSRELAEQLSCSAGCTLFAVEATDRNMPLLGMLTTNPAMVPCGVDRKLGLEGKPVIFIATIGPMGQASENSLTFLAPAAINPSLPSALRTDLANIATRFERLHEHGRATRIEANDLFWRVEQNLNWSKANQGEEVWRS